MLSHYAWRRNGSGGGGVCHTKLPRDPQRTVHGVFQGLFQVAQVHPRGAVGAAHSRGTHLPSRATAAKSAARLLLPRVSAVVSKLSRALISCRCGVDQETHSLIANLPNSLLANKARVGFEAKNCKRVLILVKSLLFYLQVTPYLQQPPFPIYFHPVILLPNKKTTKCLERYVTLFCSFIFLIVGIYAV